MEAGKPNKSTAIYEYLLNYMREHNLRRGDRLPTELELSVQFGVARITVQKAVKKLLEEKYLYRKRGSGTYVTGKHDPLPSANGGITIVPMVIAYDGMTNRSLEVIKGAESFFNEHGIYLTIHTSDGDPTYERSIIAELAEKFDSLLLMPLDSIQNKDLYASLLSRGKRLVLIDHTIAGLNVNYVASDNIRGGYLATKHLLDKGHRRILLIAPGCIQQFSSFVSRVQGYKNALEEFGFPYNPALVCEYMQNDGYASLIAQLQALDPQERPTGIFILNDLGANDLLIAFEKNGITVPGDFDIVGYDNLEIFMKRHNEVATVSQDFFRMGYDAANILFDKMMSGDDTITVRKLPVELVENKT